MKTIIAPSERKDSILESLSEQNNGIVNNVRTEPLSDALKEEKDDNEYLLLTLSSMLKKQKESFPVYGDMFSYPAFLKEILSFAKECILWNITETDLPKGNANEEELSRILATAFALPLAEKKNRKNLISRMSEIPSDTLITWSFETDPYHYQILNELKKKLPHEEYPDHTPAHTEVRYALSSRLEMESIAQYICKHNTPCNVILTNPQTQTPLLQNIFARYQIPYSAYSLPVKLHVPEIFYALVMLGLKKDRQTLLDALRVNAFSRKCPGSVWQFLDQTLTDASIPTDLSSVIKGSIFDRETKHYAFLEEKTAEYFQSIHSEYSLILSSESPKDVLSNAFEIMRGSSYLKEQSELEIGNRIRQILLTCKDLISNEEDVCFLAECIHSISTSSTQDETDFCVVTDLTHPVDPKPITFVVSASGSYYPGFPVRKGLFDESYVEKIPGYPSQEFRYEAYMSQLSWIDHSCTDNLIFSYYTNDYQGREVQLAFEIENTYTDKEHPPVRWNPVEKKPLKEREHSLNENTAEELFSDDGIVTGSVSTIERWFACPYSYWISSGLKIRKNDTASLDAASIGTIQHSVLENAVKEKGKEYTDLSEEEIRSVLDPCFEALDAVHPNDTDLNAMTKERMFNGVQNALAFLKDFEKDSSFVPKEAEYHFLENITDGVRLRGTIDRLDTYNDQLFRIIDYKSSMHNLSLPKVKAGAQLQLLSYLIIAQNLFHMEPAGAYYFSLKEDTYEDPAAKATLKEVREFTFTDEDEQERVIEKRSLKGWTFTDQKTELDTDGKHISSLKTTYDYDAVKECIELLYNYFHDHLLKGVIALDPREDACAFCDYKSICRFHGQRREIVPLVMKDKEEDLKKGKKDA